MTGLKEFQIIIDNLIKQTPGSNCDQEKPIGHSALKQDKSISGVVMISQISKSFTKDLPGKQEGTAPVKHDPVSRILKVIIKIMLLVDYSHLLSLACHPSCGY
jgi:hypothetical protein